jgi:hypothetical protein
MKSHKSKATEPSLRNRLSQSFLEALEADFKLHGAAAIEKMRASHPERYVELTGKSIMSTEPPLDKIDFKSAKSMPEIGLKLLQSVGLDEHAATDDMIEQAIKTNDNFIAKLEAIRDCAQAPEEEIH